MKKSKILLPVFMLFFSGCIENDVPLPVIKGEVLEFAVEGQKECVINKEKRLITLVLNDNVDIRKSKVTTFRITEEATTYFDPYVFVDLSSKVQFDIKTYQTYQWTIQTSQPVEREALVEGQIGAAVIDVKNLKVLINVAETQDLGNIAVESLVLGPSIATISPDPSTVTDYRWPQKFEVKYFDITEEWTVYVQRSSEIVTTGTAEPWAKFANVTGSIRTGTGETPGFEYRKQTAASWTAVPSAQIQVSGGTIKARIGGLSPSTQYVFRARLGDDTGEAVSFATEAAPVLPNMGFEEWSSKSSGTGGKTVTWYPNADASNSFWSTGNEGVTSMVAGSKNSITVPVTDVPAGIGSTKAARLTTIDDVLLAKIAAGNLYTGNYETTLSDLRASAIFGRPYTGRPIKMKGWYKYTPQIINKDKDNMYPGQMGQLDKCHIYVSLEDWQGAGSRPKYPVVIGYGEFLSRETVPEWTRFEFDIVYNDIVNKPTHISLAATSSYLGGDFCGGGGSELFVDEFEFVFE